MGLEHLSWLSAVLVVASVAAKIITSHTLTGLRQELAELHAQLRQRESVVSSMSEHRKSLEENLEFFERRREEDTDEIDGLRSEFEELEAEWRKHLEVLGYDPDADITEEFEGAASAPAGPGTAPADVAAAEPPPEAAREYRGDQGLSPDAILAVLPATVRDADKLFLPDAVITELLALGAHILERSVVTRQLAEAGEDLGRILDNEEYHRLAVVGDIDAVVVANSRLQGNGIGSATCRVVRLPGGEIVLSTAYEQPGRDEHAADFESFTATARQLAGSIHEVLRPEATAT